MNSRWRIGAFVVALALVGACSGGGDDSNKVTASESDETTTTLSVGGDETTTTAADGSGASTTVKGSSATTAKPGAASGTTAKPGGSGTTAAPAPANPNAVPGPAKTGTYTYAQEGNMNGQSVPPSGILTVTGGSTQTFARAYSSSQGVTLKYEFRGNGPFITAASVRQGGVTITCNFAGVPVPPWPPTPGATFSGNATCSNGIQATLSGNIGTRTKSGGHDIIPINATLHITGSGIDVNVQDNENWAYDLRVPTYSKQTFTGTSPIGPVNGTITSTLTGTP